MPNVNAVVIQTEQLSIIIDGTLNHYINQLSTNQQLETQCHGEETLGAGDKEMSCERCKDIHKAQVEGKTQRSCGCNCHDKLYTGTSTITGITATTCDTSGNNILFANDIGTCNTTFGLNCTCGCGCC